MGDEARDEVQRAFNTPPAQHPVRILVATDAAREGVNLQAFCADLFHFDIPWNPARLEQRNGRIDRTLQPADEVRCHYFVYPDRPEDQVLATVVHLLETTLIRVGNEDYAKQNKSYGLTTLRDRHVKIEGGTADVQGKSVTNVKGGIVNIN